MTMCAEGCLTEVISWPELQVAGVASRDVQNVGPSPTGRAA
jgi:hypothetical protein